MNVREQNKNRPNIFEGHLGGGYVEGNFIRIKFEDKKFVVTAENKFDNFKWIERGESKSSVHGAFYDVDKTGEKNLLLRDGNFDYLSKQLRNGGEFVIKKSGNGNIKAVFMSSGNEKEASATINVEGMKVVDARALVNIVTASTLVTADRMKIGHQGLNTIPSKDIIERHTENISLVSGIQQGKLKSFGDVEQQLRQRKDFKRDEETEEVIDVNRMRYIADTTLFMRDGVTAHLKLSYCVPTADEKPLIKETLSQIGYQLGNLVAKELGLTELENSENKTKRKAQTGASR